MSRGVEQPRAGEQTEGWRSLARPGALHPPWRQELAGVSQRWAGGEDGGPQPSGRSGVLVEGERVREEIVFQRCVPVAEGGCVLFK